MTLYDAVLHAMEPATSRAHVFIEECAHHHTPTQPLPIEMAGRTGMTLRFQRSVRYAVALPLEVQTNRAIREL